jgi:hypothetical protein
MLKTNVLACVAVASLVGMMPVSAADSAKVEEPWSLGCPASGLASTAQITGRPDATFTRIYRGTASEDDGVCLIEMNGRTLRMVRQVMREGSSLSDVMRGQVAGMFPARPGRQVSVTAFIPVDGIVPPVEQQFMNSYRYVGQQVISVSGSQRRVALLVHREEGRTNSYAAESHYYFDVSSHELLRFEYRPERGVPRPVFSWHVMGASR